MKEGEGYSGRYQSHRFRAWHELHYHGIRYHGQHWHHPAYRPAHPRRHCGDRRRHQGLPQGDRALIAPTSFHFSPMGGQGLPCPLNIFKLGVLIMTKRKRIEASILALFAFCLFCCGPLCQSAAAVVVVDDALLVVVLAVLSAIGITFFATYGADQARGELRSLLSEYASSIGTTLEGLFYGVNYGTSKSGKILINNRFVILIDAFASWLVSKYSLTNNDTYTLSSKVDLGSIEMVQLINNWEYWIQYNNDNKFQVGTHWGGNYENDLGIMLFACNVFERQDNGSILCRVVIITKHNGTYPMGMTSAPNSMNTAPGAGVSWWTSYVQFNSHVARWSGNKAEYTLNNQNVYVNFVGDDFPLLGASGNANTPLYNIVDFVDTFNSLSFGDTVVEIQTGIIELPLDSPDYSEGDGAIIDPVVGWGSTFDDVVEGLETDYSDTTITYDEETAIEEQVEDTPSQSISDDAAEYQVLGLQNVFPFCIPFDIYSFFECLAADPVAPVVNWRFYVPGICDETITLDLSQFNTVAQVLRTMELLAFIVGLAFVTREKFLRG